MPLMPFFEIKERAKLILKRNSLREKERERVYKRTSLLKCPRPNIPKQSMKKRVLLSACIEENISYGEWVDLPR